MILGYVLRRHQHHVDARTIRLDVSHGQWIRSCANRDLWRRSLSILMTPFDLKRMESYANNMLDYHVILDLLPTAAKLYFEKRLGSEVRLSAVQSSILLAIGLQRKTIEEVEVSTTPRSCHIRKCGDLTMEISLFLSFSSLFPLASFPFIFLIPDGTAASCLTGSGPLHKDYPKD